jgi:zinc transport system substrate-binding protein
MWRSKVLGGVAVVAALAAGACGGGDHGGGVRVVASFYPLAEAARRVGGPFVRVSNLTPVGAEPHDLELKASQVATVHDADVVLIMGRGFQPAVEKAAAERRSTIELLDALPIDHTDPAPDPHVWLDPVLMRAIVDQTAGKLAAADPAHAEAFRANASAFDSELAALDGRYRSGLTGCARKEIVTSHEAFGRMAARYGLTQESIAGLSPDAEPNPDRLAHLVDLVRAHGVTTIFTETLVSPRVAETLAREARVRTDVLDPIEGLTGAEEAAGAGYVSIMGANLTKLRAALGCP